MNPVTLDRLKELNRQNYVLYNQGVDIWDKQSDPLFDEADKLVMAEISQLKKDDLQGMLNLLRSLWGFYITRNGKIMLRQAIYDHPDFKREMMEQVWKKDEVKTD